MLGIIQNSATTTNVICTALRLKNSATRPRGARTASDSSVISVPLLPGGTCGY
jgi:hypothetical protein